MRQGKENEEKSPTLQKSPLYNLSHDTSQETRIQEQEREREKMTERETFLPMILLLVTFLLFQRITISCSKEIPKKRRREYQKERK